MTKVEITFIVRLTDVKESSITLMTKAERVLIATMTKVEATSAAIATDVKQHFITITMKAEATSTVRVVKIEATFVARTMKVGKNHHHKNDEDRGISS